MVEWTIVYAIENSIYIRYMRQVVAMFHRQTLHSSGQIQTKHLDTGKSFGTRKQIQYNNQDRNKNP